MNQPQKKYAIERVEYILKCKTATIKAAMPRKPVPRRVTYRQAVKLIKDGKVKLDKSIAVNEEMYHYKNIADMFDFSAYRTTASCSEEYDVDAFNKKTIPFYKECQRIKDQIMLGDSEEALRLIEAFEKMPSA